MRKIIFIIGIISLISSPCKGQTALNPTDYFDFWIGKWEVSWDEKDGNMGNGRNHVQWILDGRVIQENFEILEGGSKGFKGMSLSVYQSQLKIWKQSWADNQGGYFSFTGEFDNGKRIFQTDTLTPGEGVTLIQRMVFYDIKQNSFKWNWESSSDKGETWNLNWMINYKRVE